MRHMELIAWLVAPADPQVACSAGGRDASEPASIALPSRVGPGSWNRAAIDSAAVVMSTPAATRAVALARGQVVEAEPDVAGAAGSLVRHELPETGGHRRRVTPPWGAVNSNASGSSGLGPRAAMCLLTNMCGRGLPTTAISAVRSAQSGATSPFTAPRQAPAGRGDRARVRPQDRGVAKARTSPTPVNVNPAGNSGSDPSDTSVKLNVHSRMSPLFLAL